MRLCYLLHVDVHPDDDDDTAISDMYFLLHITYQVAGFGYHWVYGCWPGESRDGTAKTCYNNHNEISHIFPVLSSTIPVHSLPT